MKISLFIIGVALYHSGRPFLMLASYVKVNFILLNFDNNWSPSTQHEIGEINFLIIKYAFREQLEIISSN